MQLRFNHYRPLNCRSRFSISPTTSSAENCWIGWWQDVRPGRAQSTLPDFERAGTQVISEDAFLLRLKTIPTRKYVLLVQKSLTTSLRWIAVGQTSRLAKPSFAWLALEKREQFLIGGGGDDQNNVIHVRFSVAQKLKPNADDIYILTVAGIGMMDEAKDQVRDMLRIRRQVAFAADDNFGMQTSEGILDNFRSITGGRQSRW